MTSYFISRVGDKVMEDGVTILKMNYLADKIYPSDYTDIPNYFEITYDRYIKHLNDSRLHRGGYVTDAEKKLFRELLGKYYSLIALKPGEEKATKYLESLWLSQYEN